MNPEFDPVVVHNKYVFVGTTALGLGDALPTPVSGESVPMPGVEINANLFDALENNLVIEPMNTWIMVVLTLLFILIPLLLYSLFSQRMVPVMVLVALIITVSFSTVMLAKMHVWFPPAPVLFVLLLSYPLWTWRRLEKLVRTLFTEREQTLVTLHSIGDGVIKLTLRGMLIL